jgi:hypothetical protein
VCVCGGGGGWGRCGFRDWLGPSTHVRAAGGMDRQGVRSMGVWAGGRARGRGGGGGGFLHLYLHRTPASGLQKGQVAPPVLMPSHSGLDQSRGVGLVDKLVHLHTTRVPSKHLGDPAGLQVRHCNDPQPKKPGPQGRHAHDGQHATQLPAGVPSIDGHLTPPDTQRGAGCRV